MDLIRFHNKDHTITAEVSFPGKGTRVTNDLAELQESSLNMFTRFIRTQMKENYFDKDHVFFVKRLDSFFLPSRTHPLPNRPPPPPSPACPPAPQSTCSLF